jgi:hypothetical protein
MKSKLFLQEGEIQRILSMHKDKINEERGQKKVIKEDVEQALKGFFTMCSRYRDESLGEYTRSEIAGIARKIQNSIEYNEFLGAGTQDQELDTQKRKLAKKGNLYDLCNLNQKYIELTGDALADALIGDLSDEKLTGWRNAIDYMDGRTQDANDSKNKKEKNIPKGTQTACPKSEKQLLDKGYRLVDKATYYDSKTDPNLKVYYFWCKLESPAKNLYFQKYVRQAKIEPEPVITPAPTETSGSTSGSTIPQPEENNNKIQGGGGKSSGGRYTFDYNKVMEAINQKCPKKSNNTNANTNTNNSNVNNSNIDLDLGGGTTETPKMSTDIFQNL